MNSVAYEWTTFRCNKTEKPLTGLHTARELDNECFVLDIHLLRWNCPKSTNTIIRSSCSSFNLSTFFSLQIFDLLPVTKASYIPYDVHDAVECLRVRPRRYIHPHPSESTDAFTVFQVNQHTDTVIIKDKTFFSHPVNGCMLFECLERWTEDGYKPVYPNASMPQLQRKRIPPRPPWPHF